MAEKELTESRQQLRQLSAFLQEVREEERSRISRELHDELGQTLTALTMGLQWVEKRLAPAEMKLRNRVQALGNLTQATAGAVRRIASDKKLGLIGMRERAYMLGGSFRISSVESIGTVIEVANPKNAKGAGRQS